MEENKNSFKNGKNNIDDCLQKFQKYILSNINDIPKIKNNLLNLSKEGKTESELMRVFSYKIYLNVLPSNKDSNLKKWIEETLVQRNLYKEKQRNLIKDDKKEINDIINIDIENTFKDKEIFNESSIKEIENNILLLLSEDNHPISYKKGMDVILNNLIFSLYPYYIKSDIKEYNNELFEKWINDPIKNIKDIYFFFHDENEFQCDIYCLMINLMKLGVNNFYEENEKDNNNLSKRCENIINKFKIQNNKLYNHLINIKLDFRNILQNWIKYLFTNVLNPKDCSIIWDIIFANENIEHSGKLIYIDYFCLSLLDFISDDLLKNGVDECSKKLLNYPNLQNLNLFLTLFNNIKSKINNIDKKRNSSTATGPGSMANFLYSVNKNKVVKTPNLMFGGEYSNKNNNKAYLTPKTSQNENKQVFPKKIPMFGNISNNNKIKKTIQPVFINTRAYTVSNSENVKMLNELKGLIDNYINEFSDEDKMKIGFLFDKLGKEL